MRILLLGFIALIVLCCLVTAENASVVGSAQYTLAPLPYEKDALEPYISERTMHFHYDMHHKSYVTSLNKLTKEMWDFPALQKDLADGNLPHMLRENGRYLPHSHRAEFMNSAGGFLNHNIFWKSMRAPRENNIPPTDSLIYKNITQSWGSFEAFQESFGESAKVLFGSGWTWLMAGCDEENYTVDWLTILNFANQEYPHFGIPLLPLDLFEHSYYLDYQNRRLDYVKNWWNIVNWDYVEATLQAACADPKHQVKAKEAKDEL